MDTWTAQHLTTWADQQFHDESEREECVKILTDLWDADPEYWTSHSHSWWEMLDIGKRNRGTRSQVALRKICKS